MVEATSIALSSSPSRASIAVTPTHTAIVAMSSSPVLPSPSQLFSEMGPQLSSGSRVKAIPNDAVAGFTSASTLLRQARRDNKVGNNSTVERLGLPERLCLPKGSVKQATSEKVEVEGVKEKILAFKDPMVLFVEDAAPGQPVNHAQRTKESLPHGKADEGREPAKTTKKKSKNEMHGQTKIKTAKITKPGTSQSCRKSKKVTVSTKKTQTKESAQNSNTLLPPQEENAIAREEFRDLCLEKAIPLRRNWTPCKDTVRRSNQEETSTVPELAPHMGSPNQTMLPEARFGQLLGNYTLTIQGDGQLSTKESLGQERDDKAFKKRKIELLSGVPGPPQTETSRKIKSPKKKPQTITEKATAPFIATDATASSSLLQYFGPTTAAEVLACNKRSDNNGSVITHRKARTKPPSKSKVSVSKTILMSPESAMKNLGDQELLFGTSSQLAREESPTLIRNLQQATEESVTSSQGWDSSVLPAGKFRTSNSLALVRSRNLWSIASRDFEGTTFEAETVDLTKTPKPLTKLKEAESLPADPDGVEVQVQEELGAPILPRESSNSPNLTLSPTPCLQNEVQEKNLLLPRSVAEATLRKRPNNRSPIKNATNPKLDPKQMPNYHGFTDAQLSKEVRAYGFKSIKKRIAMITLLEQCWVSKVSMALQEVEANLKYPPESSGNTGKEEPKQKNSSAKRGRPPKRADFAATLSEDITAVPQKKPRGRPKKDPKANNTSPKANRNIDTTIQVHPEPPAPVADEICDSSPPTPTAPRRRSSASKSPGQLRLSQPIRTTIDAKNGAPEALRSRILERMTEAITTFPPTHDIKNLTFYEKILMYEPVVLEDLAVWLNTRGLARVGEDDEVSPELVKDWCEQRSVCCLWRENLRGGARARW